MRDVFGKLIQIIHVDMEESMGEYDSQTLTIKIKKGLQISDEISTDLHEFLHAVFDRIGVSAIISNDLEEIIAHCVSEALCENYDIEPKN